MISWVLSLLLILLLVVVVGELLEDGCLLLCNTVLTLAVGALGAVDEATVALSISVANATLTLLECEVCRLILLGWHMLWVGTDGLVDSEVHVLHAISSDTCLDVLGELGSVLLGLFLVECLHVGGHVPSEDALLVSLSIVLLLFSVVAVEPLVAVRDLEATVEGALHGTEDLGAQGGWLEANIEQSMEGVAALVLLVGDVAVLELTSDLLGANEFGVETLALQETTSAEETHTVGGGVVGETSLEAVASKLTSVGCGVADIALDLG